MVKVADYIIQFLENKGVKHAFEVPGGGAMYLNDAVAKSNITPIFCHHEQSCAMAAVGYSKVTNDVSLVIPTSGCGSTNTITGILDAWQDSNKVFIVSGQANLKETTYYKGIPLRKLGVQEVNIIPIVQSITKYSVTVTDPTKIKYILEKAYHLCTTGRPGPVWIDVPLDIQSSLISPDELESYDVISEESNVDLSEFAKLLSQAERPIVIAGGGIDSAGARNELKQFIEYYNIPCAVTFLGIDFLEENHPLYVGRIGLKGTRAGNFAVQNSDLIIALGSSLSVPATGFKYELFGREAKIVVVDIDPIEHAKETVRIDSLIEKDVKQFLLEFINNPIDYKVSDFWSSKCLSWKTKWSPFNRPDIDELNMYSFSKELTECTKNLDSVVTADAGSAYYVLAQSLMNNTLVLPSAQGEMGFTLPATVGIAVAQPERLVIGVTGEGSFQFNIQELQTIVQNKLPIKLFILNNDGYLSIRNTQTKLFEKRLSGVSADSGVSFPDCGKIADAYGFKFYRINTIDELKSQLPEILALDTYCLCEVMCPVTEEIYPTSATMKTEDGKLSSQPLENMAPFLSKEEYEAEMIIPIYKL
jgi:acetolactate synthase-1/2/3 large subunit